jgi:hypothetical protein
MAQFSIEEIPAFYHRYVEPLKEQNLIDALEQTSRKVLHYLGDLEESNGDFRYAPGKWSVKEVLGHMLDAERVFSFRALTFARNDKTELPGFDENAYAPETNAASRTIADLVLEASRLRATSLDLFKSFTPEMLGRIGTANKGNFTVRGIGYIIAGHELHHLTILQDRYFPG